MAWARIVAFPGAMMALHLAWLISRSMSVVVDPYWLLKTYMELHPAETGQSVAFRPA